MRLADHILEDIRIVLDYIGQDGKEHREAYSAILRLQALGYLQPRRKEARRV